VIGDIASRILTLPPWLALLVVFAMPALESSAFLGFVFPGEVALILGGVLASQGKISLAAVLAAAIAGSVVGDSVGYVFGRRYGRRMLDGTVGRLVRRHHLDSAQAYLSERGGKAVFFGRFTAALRVMVPGLAGMSGMPYRTFALFNVASAICWGTMSVLFGYLGGSSWRHVEHVASRVGLGALALVVMAVVAGHLVRRGHLSRLGRAPGRLASSRPVRRASSRFPRASRWVANRLDPRSPTGLVTTVAWIVAAASAWAFLGITQDVVAREELVRLDPQVHAWILAHRVVPLDRFFVVVTWLGANAVVLPVLLVGGALVARAQRSWRPVVSIAVVYASAVLLHAVVALAVHRPRPDPSGWLSPAAGWAYPSGHTTQAVAGWGILALVAAVGAGARHRATLLVSATVVAGLVAASRVYLGVHWLSDVLGAITLSGTLLAVWVALTAGSRRR
jgi:undecaprenyl-diphosphatase